MISSSKKKKKSEKRMNGFEKGMEAEEILGATEWLVNSTILSTLRSRYFKIIRPY